MSAFHSNDNACQRIDGLSLGANAFDCQKFPSSSLLPSCMSVTTDLPLEQAGRRYPSCMASCVSMFNISREAEKFQLATMTSEQLSTGEKPSRNNLVQQTETITIISPGSKKVKAPVELVQLAEEGKLDDLELSELGTKPICKAFTILGLAVDAGDNALVEVLEDALERHDQVPDMDDVKAVLERFEEGSEARAYIVEKLAKGIFGGRLNGGDEGLEGLKHMDEDFRKALETAINEAGQVSTNLST